MGKGSFAKAEHGQGNTGKGFRGGNAVKRDAVDFRATVIGVIGGKKSGKTTTIEILTRELTKRGYKVAVAKHIPEPNFTIDTEGKDTWRYTQSGAKTVVAASANEVATIEKTRANLSLKEILHRCKGSDIVFLEGFRKLLAEDKGIHKIVVAESTQDIEEAVKVFMPILAFTGPYSPRKANPKIPHMDILTHGKEMADLVEKVVRKKL
jgi:molybdopterin-guanine dinucleotide biosynthesis protein B